MMAFALATSLLPLVSFAAVSADRTTIEQRLPTEIEKLSDATTFSYSPMSLGRLLALLGSGASGNTRRQLNSFLGLPPESVTEQLAASYPGFSAAEGHVAEERSSLWLRVGSHVRQSFRAQASTLFAADIFTIGFRSDLIREWVARNTGKQIADYTVRPRIDFLALNAMRFRSKWQVAFDTGSTTRASFHGKSKNSNAMFMHSLRMLSLFTSSDMRVVRLKLRDHFSMYVGLSTNPQAPHIAEFVAALARPDFQSERVRISMPRLDLQSHVELTNGLQHLGVVDAFLRPRFPLICGIGLTAAYQDVALSVNEEGAAAGVATTFYQTQGIESPTVDFKVDRPFDYAIVNDRNSALVLLGRVQDL
jgi:serine protease inhibitor